MTTSERGPHTRTQAALGIGNDEPALWEQLGQLQVSEGSEATVSGTGQTTPAIDGGTWDFLANAAQMFDRRAELSHVTAADIGRGFDMQGYPVKGYALQHRLYMTYRRQVYPQTQGVEYDLCEARRQARVVDGSAQYYRFRQSALGDVFRSHVTHFQLRDLLWATSAHDVFYGHADGIRRWDPMKRTSEFVVTWDQMPGSFRLTAMCADAGAVFAGDCYGRYCVKALGGTGVGALSPECLDANDSANHVSPMVVRSGVPAVSVSHNGGAVRQVDVAKMAVTGERRFAWPVNCTATALDGSMQCVAGDSTDALLVDPRQPSRVSARLTGHLDYVFACAISHDGLRVATGSQDTTVRLYDARWPTQAVGAAAGLLGAMRVVKFSACGRYLMATEPADYVHVYDARTMATAQDIEVMGEIAGAAFAPDAQSLFFAIADPMHSSGLVEFTGMHPSGSECLGGIVSPSLLL